MISFLQGILASKSPERVEVDVNGVGYELAVSQKTYQSLPAPGQTLLLKAYLHVREDVMQLYGFAGDAEKQAFLLLISVSGVGPKAALGILSSFTPEQLFRAVAQGVVPALRTAPGVGQKTAQHLVLELREKVTKLSGAGVFSGEEPVGAGAQNLGDAIQAMLALGYSAAEARRAVLTAAQSLGRDPGVEDILKLSLKTVAGS
ncbi:MAG TPA: Holliday junction branch migration protein RuvA [bacterium]|nr:Holliday junction branch migration protein RuvA [bacterium]